MNLHELLVMQSVASQSKVDLCHRDITLMWPQLTANPAIAPSLKEASIGSVCAAACLINSQSLRTSYLSVADAAKFTALIAEVRLKIINDHKISPIGYLIAQSCQHAQVESPVRDLGDILRDVEAVRYQRTDATDGLAQVDTNQGDNDVAF